MKKRILSVLLALCMCLTLVPVTVLADDDIQQGNGISVLSITPDEGTYYTYVFTVDGKEIDRQIVKNGDTLREPEVPAQDGKVFTGWDQTVPFGVIAGLTGDNRTITVAAQFAEEGYPVYFKDNSGRIIATKKGKTGDNITFEDVNFPVGADEAITGWYTDEGFTTKVDSITIATSSVTLYGKVEKGYWVTFESNGGSYVAPAFYANGTPAAAPDKPTKSGYTFAGWFTDKELTQTADFSSITATTTLYAKWTAGTETKYTVIHFWENANDDGYSFKESETKTGATGDKTNATAKRYPGFTAQTITQQDIKGDGSTIVSVKYKRNVYSVQFYSNSGIFSSSKEYPSLRITAKYGASIGDKWPTYNGSNTWATSDGGSTFQANIDTMPLNGANFYGPKTGWGSETAYYYVEVLPGEAGTVYNGVTYKEHHHDTSPGRGFTVSQEDKYAITGFTYKEGTRNGSSYNNAKFYYTRNEYKIVFVNNGSTDKPPVAKKFEQSIADAGYTPTAPAGMTDYVFAGWYDNELGEGAAYVFDGKTMPAQNITLYAKWVAPTYTVTVHGVDGTVLETFTEVAKNSTISSDEMPALTLAEGETFLGWVQEDGTPFNFSTKINQNYDLYAKVGNSSRYKVTYHSNTTPDTTVTDSEMIYAKDVLATVNNNTFTNSGKIFLSWNTRADGKGETCYPNGTIKVTGNMDLYAQWGDVASTVTVTYHSNFDTDQTKSVAAVANNSKITVEAYNALNLPERTGYSFVGWNTKADGTGSTFAAGASARVDVKKPNDLYAQWTINQYNYTVEYYIDNVKNALMTETSKADFGSEINSYTNKCPDGYALEKTENLPLTIGVNESANVIKVFYKKNVFNLTIHYVYAEDQSKAADDYTKSVTFNDTYTVTSPTINGYTADTTVVSGKMPAENVEVTVTYTKRSDLSYTVHYYWNGTTESVKPSETFGNQTYQDKVTKSPAAIDGYTAVSKDSKTITIGTGANVIIFYYYKNVELTANSKTETYDGTEKSVSGFTGAPADADFSAITVGAKGTEADTYPASFADGTVGTVDATEKYIVTAANDGTLVITPVEEVIVTITGHNDSVKYDGATHTVDGYDVAIDNELYTEQDFTFSGSSTVSGTNAKTSYEMGLKAGDFTNNSKNFTNVTFQVTDGYLTITKRNVTLTSGSDSKAYDGTPLTKNEVTVSGDGFAEGEGASYNVTGTITNVGSVKNTFTYTLNEGTLADNYNIAPIPGDLTITADENEVVVTIVGNTDNQMYDGKAHTVTGYEVTNISNSLYTEGDFTFNGNAEITGTDAKTSYMMGLKAGDFTNTNDNFAKVTFVVTDGSLTITKRTVVMTSGSASRVYNGEPLTNGTVTVSGDGFAEGEGASYNVTGTITNVGKVDNEFTYKLNANTKAGNYEITTTPGELEVTPVTDKVTVTITGKTGSFKYDGDVHTVTDYDVAIDNSLYTENDFSFSGNAAVSGTNVADSADMGLTADDFTNTNDNFTNVEFVVNDGSLTITKRSVKLISGDGKKVYDGTPLINKTVTVGDDGFAKGEGATYDVTGTITNVGKVDNTFDYNLKSNTKADNYNITKETGTLEVTPVTDKVTVTITEHGGSAKYDGTEKTVTGYDVAISNPLYTEDDFTFSGNATVKGTDVGTYDMELKSSDFTNISKNFSNVEFVIEDGSLVIDPAEVTVTIKGNTDEVTYNGKEQSVEGYTFEITDKTGLYTVNDFALIEGVTAVAKGTDAGEYFMGLTVDSFTNSNPNFKVTFVVEDGKLTIKPAEVTVTIKGNTAEVIYNGKEQSVEGYTFEITDETELYAESDFVLKDGIEAVAKGTNANDPEGTIKSYPMGLTKDSFENKNVNFAVTFEVTDGSLTIAKRDVTVTGESATKSYNGQTQEITGYTVDNLVEGHKMTGVTYSAKGKDPGKYDGSFTGSQIVITDADGSNVTENYNVKTVIGALTITQPSHPTRPSTPTKDVTSVKTADGSQMTLWMSMTLASAAGIVFFGKKRKEEQ